MAHIEKRLEKQIAAETGHSLGSLKMPEISEVVSRTVGEPSGGGESDQTTSPHKPSFWGGVSGQISKLLSAGEKQVQILLPTPEIQVKLVKSAIEREQKKLLKEAKNLQSGKKFSAAKLEEIVARIRYLQKILESLLSSAKEQIEKLYRRFVLHAE